jgi:hypothetical protein
VAEDLAERLNPATRDNESAVVNASHLDTLLVCFIGLSFPLWLAAGGGHQLLGIVLALALDLGEIIGSQRDIRRGEVLFQQMEGAQLFR